MLTYELLEDLKRNAKYEGVSEFGPVECMSSIYIKSTAMATSISTFEAKYKVRSIIINAGGDPDNIEEPYFVFRYNKGSVKFSAMYIEIFFEKLLEVLEEEKQA
jgi:hypothetical protein